MVTKLAKSCSSLHVATIRAIRIWTASSSSSPRTPKKVGWRDLLVGDMSQPRGEPMLSGHTSRQVGLDVDIEFAPMPDHAQSREEREFSSATDVGRAQPARQSIRKCGPMRVPSSSALLRRDPAVTRIFVNAAIEQALCREAEADRG